MCGFVLFWRSRAGLSHTFDRPLSCYFNLVPLRPVNTSNNTNTTHLDPSTHPEQLSQTHLFSQITIAMLTECRVAEAVAISHDLQAQIYAP